MGLAWKLGFFVAVVAGKIHDLKAIAGRISASRTGRT